MDFENVKNDCSIFVITQNCGNRSTHSIYILLNSGRIKPKESMIWWKLLVPSKIRIFMWLVSHNTILTKDNLNLKGWIGDQTCHLCTENESIDDLLIKCHLAQPVL